MTGQHPAVARAAVCSAGSSTACLLPPWHCPALLAVPWLPSPPLPLRVLGWNRVPLKLQRCLAIHNCAVSCPSNRFPPLFPSPSSWCLHSRFLKLSFWLRIFLKSKPLQILTTQQGWEDGCTLHETAHCLLLGRTDPDTTQYIPRYKLFQLPLWAVKTLPNAHNVFHVPGHSQLTNMQHYEN